MRKWIVMALVVLSLGSTGVGLALAGGGSAANSPAKAAAVRPAASHAAPAHRISQATRHTAVRSSSQENSTDDPDNVKQGDQSAPDGERSDGDGAARSDATSTSGESENGGESESSGDTETGQRGEPPAGKGHEDSPGQDVNHECTGDCVE
jgi:hypothetical protein